MRRVGLDGDYEFDDDPVVAKDVAAAIVLQPDKITMDTAIPAGNIGYRMLVKGGWKPGSGLGAGASGIIEPVRLAENVGLLGVGKLAEDLAHTSATVSRKRNVEENAAVAAEALAVGVGSSEDVEVASLALARKREKLLAEGQRAVEKERRAFHCDVCAVQFEKVTDWEIHLSGYSHGHKVRLREMKATMLAGSAADRKTKKQKAEDREMRRAMKQAKKASKLMTQVSSQNPSPPPPPPTTIGAATPFPVPPPPPQTPTPPSPPPPPPLPPPAPAPPAKPTPKMGVFKMAKKKRKNAPLSKGFSFNE